MKYLVTGGAGFIGSHIIKELLNENHSIICVDNLSSGNKINIIKFLSHPNFQFLEHDITKPLEIETEGIWHFACPASPKFYTRNPIDTAKINFLGTYNMLELAKKNKAIFLLASSSEVYGDPERHPQVENYNGSVNTIGKRSCYVEGKRIAETLCFSYQNKYNLNIKIARIFNTYGPNMMPNDGRVISNFISKAILNRPLLIYGQGDQTRSFCYIDDLVQGLLSLFNSSINEIINLGNPNQEISIKQLSEFIIKKLNSSSIIKNIEPFEDDPQRRKPSINKAKMLLNFQPKYSLDIGLDYTIKYIKNIINND